MFTPLPNALAAARHARGIANLARNEAGLNPAGETLRVIADLLDIAALSFETEPQGHFDGVRNEIPSDAVFALADAEALAARNPVTGFPARFGAYVTRPYRWEGMPVPDPMEPVSSALAAQEADLRVRLATVHAHLLTSAVEEITDALLISAFTLHGKLARLAADVRADNARPRD